MRTTILCMAAGVLASWQVSAAAPSQYDACLDRAQTDPAGAFADAGLWAKRGGGAPADHCAAVALVGLRRYGDAASRLDFLARSPFASDASRKAALFDQAGNAWLLAGRPDSAVASFTAGLAANSYDADLLSDRARALALQQNWAKADADLGVALLVNPDRADLYVLRGSARHALGRKADARADFDRALKLQPSNADALVERGTMKFEAGDAAGARADWQRAVAVAPDSAAADTARQHLTETAH